MSGYIDLVENSVKYKDFFKFLFRGNITSKFFLRNINEYIFLLLILSFLKLNILFLILHLHLFVDLLPLVEKIWMSMNFILYSSAMLFLYNLDFKKIFAYMDKLGVKNIDIAFRGSWLYTAIVSYFSLVMSMAGSYLYISNYNGYREDYFNLIVGFIFQDICLPFSFLYWLICCKVYKRRDFVNKLTY